MNSKLPKTKKYKMNHNAALTHNHIPQEIPREERVHFEYEVTGVDAVNSHNKAVHRVLEAGQYEDAIERARVIEENKIAATGLGKIRRSIGRRLGTVMTEDEETLVDYAARKQNVPSFLHEAAAKEAFFTKDNLLVVRMELREIDKDVYEASNVEGDLDQFAPTFLKAAKDKAGEGVTWRSWLTEAADDEQLTNFLRWHTARQAELAANPEFQQQVEQLKQDYKDRLEEGIAEGWTSEQARDIVGKIDDMRVHAGDAFYLLRRQAKGYHTPGKNYVVAEDVRNKETVYHELDHPFFQYGPRWRDEAFTEHHAQVMVHGQPNVMNPYFRPKTESSISYPQERKVMDYILRGGAFKIPAELGLRAFTGTETEKQQFESAVDRSWGHVLPEGISVLNAVDQYIDKKQAEFTELANGKDFEDTPKDMALISTLTALRTAPELIFGKKEEKSVQQILAPETVVVSESFRELVSLAVEKGMLAGEDSAKTTKSSESRREQDIDPSVRNEIRELSEKGLTNKQVFRRLAREYHTDANGAGDDKAHQKLADLSRWNERVSKEQQRAKGT